MQIVLTQKLPAERLTHLDQVVQIRAGVAGAGRAVAVRIERQVGHRVNGPAHLQVAARGEGPAALRHLRRDDAVEHVDPAVHGLQEVERRAHAHQVPGLLLRHLLGGERAHVLALCAALADREAADRVAVERHLGEARRTLAPQVGEERPLHDAEEGLRGLSLRLLQGRPRAFRQRTAQRAVRSAAARAVARSTVDATQWSKAIMMSPPIAIWVAMLDSGERRTLLVVDVAAEGGALLRDGSRAGEREDLDSRRSR